MDSSEQLQTRAALLRRLANPADVVEAGRALRKMEFDERVARGPGEDLSWEANEEKKLADRRRVLSLLADELDRLIPEWVARLVERVRADDVERQRRSAAIKARQELPAINWGSIFAVDHLQTTLQALGDRIDPHLRPLIDAMGSMDRDADEDLAAAVKRTGPALSMAVPRLLDMLHRWGIWRLRSQLAEALANASRFDDRVLTALQEILSSGAQDQRASAMRVLELMGSGARPVAGQLLSFHNGSERDRCGMIHTLATQGAPTPEFLAILEAAMRDESGYVRRSATWALGRLTPDPARFVPLLIEACDWEQPLHDTSLPEAAVEALGNYGPRASAALPRLARFLEGPMKDRAIRSDRVRTAMERVSGSPVLSGIRGPEVRRGALGEDEPLFPVKYQGRQCYIDRDGRLAIQTRFDSGQEFSEGLAIVRNHRAPAFVIDRQGRMAFESHWDEIRPFAEGLAPVKKDEKWGFVDLEGRTVISPQYDSVTPFAEGLAGFEVGRTQEKLGRSATRTRRGLCGFIDRSGTTVIPAHWNGAGAFRERRALVRTGGTMKPNPLLGDLETLHEAKSGFIDRTGRLVIDGNFDLAFSFSEGLAVVQRGDGCARARYGYIDPNGTEMIPLSWTFAMPFSDGVALVRRRGRRSRGNSYAIDRSGNVLGELPYPAVESFSEGLAAAWSGQAYGFINVEGQWVIEPQFDQCGAFHHGVADVQREDWYGLIDRTGRFIWGPTTEGSVWRASQSEWTD